MYHASKGVLLIKSGEILEAISDSNFERGTLPEPFDLPNHVGNFREASIATVFAYVMIGICACARPMLEGSREMFKRNARRAAVGAFAVSSAVQVLGEKFAFYNSLGGSNIGDPIDAAYGIAWSAVTAVAAHRMVTGLEQRSYENGLQPEVNTAEAEAALPLAVQMEDI